jgi:hypothetical protein
MRAQLLLIRADCTYQYKERKITYAILCPSTIWQVVHMLFVDIGCLYCASVFVRAFLWTNVIVTGTTMSKSYVTQLPLAGRFHPFYRP